MKLDIAINLTATIDELVEEVRGEERFLEFAEVQLQQTRHRVDVLCVDDVLQWVITCQRYTKIPMYMRTKKIDYDKCCLDYNEILDEIRFG